jgi:hypothetical protein
MLSKIVIFAVATASAVVAQNTLYSQCGGQDWSGSTSCVSGASCQYQNAYYSQCLPSDSGSSSGSSETTTTAAASTASSSPSSTVSSGGAASTGKSFKASFTEYGTGDQNGSPDCNTLTTACGFYTSPGYSAAVSQNEFGVGPGAGAGPACGTCWKLTIETDSSGNTVSNAGNSIVVQVTNLCPAEGNPLCAQDGLTGTNQYGANLNFDTCIDSGASAALFGDSGVGLGVGTAEEVDCKGNWSGTVVS